MANQKSGDLGSTEALWEVESSVTIFGMPLRLLGNRCDSASPKELALSSARCHKCERKGSLGVPEGFRRQREESFILMYFNLNQIHFFLFIR